MKVVIIEDEILTARQTIELLQNYHKPVEILATIDSVAGVKELIPTLPRADIFLVDIQLTDGIIFDALSISSIQTPVIIITAYETYLIRCFELLCIDYLLKPLKKEQFYSALDKLDMLQQFNKELSFASVMTRLKRHLDNTQKKQLTWLVKERAKLMPISVDKIAYFERFSGIVKCILFDGRSFVLDENSLDNVANKVDTGQFYRINRSVLVNRLAILEITYFSKEKWLISTRPESKLPVYLSRIKLTEFKNWMSGI